MACASLGKENRIDDAQFGGGTPGMVLDLEQMAATLEIPANISIEKVNHENLAEYCDVVGAGFGIPGPLLEMIREMFAHLDLNPRAPLRNYTARLDGQPVCATLLYLNGETAGMYNVATVPAVRGKGIGTPVLWQALDEARSEGYRVGVLQSSEMGFSVYERPGFKQHCMFNNYVWSPG